MAEEYSIKKIMNIIKYYHINMKNIKSLTASSEMKSVGVAKYGLESSGSPGNQISSVVENEVLRQLENTKFFANTLTDLKYIQDRWHRITDEREAQILNLRLDGYSVSDISALMKMDRSSVYKTLKQVAYRIKSYPQSNETNSTNSTNF